MRRRTQRLGGRRTTIYIIIVGLLLAAHYLYDNFAPDAAIASQPTEEITPIEEEAPSEAAPRSRSNTRQWAELPAMKRADKANYITSHHSGTMRSYTVCYSSEHHSPLWVAAPMHKAYTGDVKRVDNYDFDPTLPVNIQTRLNRSYGDYTRGHMLGSAERTATTHMNNQTFYVTNIAPQLREGFNERGGAWNNLEYFVDRQVCADTLYVVTGAIYERFTDSDGTHIEPRTTRNKNDGEQIGVPTAYYKALLRTKSGRSGRSVMECRASELKCAAFIVGHRSAAGRKPTADDMISIKELERLTGIDFFASVPNAPESQAVASDWGL